MDDTNYLAARIEQAKKDRARDAEQRYQLSSKKESMELRDQVIADQFANQAGDDYLSQRIAQAKGERAIQNRRQQRQFAEQADPEMVAKTKNILEYVSNSSNRFGAIEALRQLSPEEQQAFYQLAPGVMQQLGDDRGNIAWRTLNALWKGTNEQLINPMAEMVGGLGLSEEEIETARYLEGLRAQEAAPTRGDDPWYVRGPLGAVEMAPWAVAVSRGGGLGASVGTKIGSALATRAAAGGKTAQALLRGSQAVGAAPAAVGLPQMTAAGVGQLAGVTGAAYPAMYIQEYHDLKELGMEDDWKLRALAGGTALVGSAIEGIVPDILPGRVRLNQGVANAARQYLWEAAKKMPGELSEEGLQELTSGLGKHIASYIDENVEDRQLSKTFQDSWKAMEESALPMAFLMGIPAVGTAGLATPIAMRETSQFRDMAANLTPEQSAQAIARLNELQQIKNMKFIPEDVAREAGIPGATRKERMDNLNEEMFQLKSLADLATRTGRTRPAEGFQGDSTTVPGMSPPTEGVFNEVRQQGQQVEQGPQQVEGDRQVLQEELRPQEEVDQIAFDAISEPGRQAAIAAQQEVAPPEATNQEEAAPDPRPADGDFNALAEWAERQAEKYEAAGRPEQAVAARLQAQQARNEAKLAQEEAARQEEIDKEFKRREASRKKQSEATTSKDDQSQATPSVGQSVQWTSNGVDQFKEPRKVTGLSDDGKFVFVEGSGTGIPVSEARIAESTAPPVPQVGEHVSLMGKKFKRSEVIDDADGVRNELFESEDGSGIIRMTELETGNTLPFLRFSSIEQARKRFESMPGVSQFRAESLASADKSQPSRSEDVIDTYKKDPQLASLFESDAGVKEGYTVEEHTKKVLANWKKQSAPEGLKDIGSRVGSKRLPELMEHVVALHDIGKPIAIKEGDKSKQHSKTLPILERQLNLQGFSQSEIAVAKALVNNDVIGELIQGKTSAANAAERLTELAKSAGIEARDFFALQSSLYKADAGSYPSLAGSIFSEGASGKLTLPDVNFGILEEIFYGQVYEAPWSERTGPKGKGPEGGRTDRGGVEGRYVHGSAINFESYDESKDSGKNRVGKGLYLVDQADGDVASHYAIRAIKRILAGAGFKKSLIDNIMNLPIEALERGRQKLLKQVDAFQKNGDSKQAARHETAAEVLGEMIAGRIGKHVIPVEFSPKRIFEMGSEESGGRVMRKEEVDQILSFVPQSDIAKIKSSIKQNPRAFELYNAMSKVLGSREAATKAIRSAGYDAIQFIHVKGGYSRPYNVMVSLAPENTSIGRKESPASQEQKANAAEATANPTEAEFDAMADAALAELKNKRQPAPQSEKGATESPKREKRTGRKSDQTKADAAAKRAAARKAMSDVMKKLDGMATSGVNPAIMKEIVGAALLYVESGVTTFKGYVEAIVEDFGDAWAMKYAPYLEAAWRSLNRSGDVKDAAGKFGDYIQKADQKAEKEPKPAATKQKDEAAAFLKRFNLQAFEFSGRYYIQGEGTHGWKETIKEAGIGNGGARQAQYRGKFAWQLTKAGYERLQEILRGLPIPDGATGSSIPDYVRDSKLRQLRADVDGRPDNRKSPGTLKGLVSDTTKRLIEGGAKFGIPQEILNEQVEDVGMILDAQARGERMFLLANEPGSGKTFVLGAAIRELQAKGAKTITYVTLRKELISQIQKDLANYGINNVQFLTYAGLRTVDKEAKRLKNRPIPTDVLIFDEAHSIKNLESSQGEAAEEWVALSKFSIFASATPFENPIQAKYMSATGVFDDIGGFKTFATIFGARVSQVGKRVAIYWERTATSDEDAKAAQNYMAKRGLITNRRIRLPAGQVDSRMVKVNAPQIHAERYSQFSQAAVAQKEKLNGHGAAWIVNLQKRMLEDAKLELAMQEADAAIERGRFPVIFVETKEKRGHNIPDLIEREENYKRDAAIARANRDAPPKRKDYGLPPAGVVDVLAAYMRISGQERIDIASPMDTVKARFGSKLAIFTGERKGTVTKTSANRDLASWRAGTKPVLLATMQKGGTGLSLHDTKGDHPTTQIGVNMPWTATQLVQVAQRSARYGLAGKAEIIWLFADNIPFDRMLAGRVGGRMADMGSTVHGQEAASASTLLDWNFEDELFSEEMAEKEAPKPEEQVKPKQKREKPQTIVEIPLPIQEGGGWEKISNWRVAVEQSIKDDPMRASSIMRRVASRTNSDAEANEIIDLLEDGYAERSNVAMDIIYNPKLSESVRRKAADWYDKHGLSGSGIAHAIIDKNLGVTKQGSHVPSGQHADKAADILSEMEANQAKFREEKKRLEGEKLANWLKAFAGSPRETTAAKDLYRKDFEKAQQNGISDDRLIEIINHGAANGMFSEQEASDLKARIKPVAKVATVESLLARADKYRNPGESFNRNIAATAKRLEIAISKGHAEDSSLVNGLMDELEMRLDYWEPIIQAESRQQKEEAAKSPHDMTREEVDAILRGDDLDARKPVLQALFPEWVNQPEPIRDGGDFAVSLWGEVNEPNRWGVGRVPFPMVADAYRRMKTVGQMHYPDGSAYRAWMDRTHRIGDKPTSYLSGHSSGAVREAAKQNPGLGLVITPQTKQYVGHGGDYSHLMVDNGVFAEFTRSAPFNEKKFFELLDSVVAAGLKDKVQFVVVPDKVGDWEGTTARWKEFSDRVRAYGMPLAYVGQDGIEDHADQIPWDDFDVFFIGGSTPWKLGYNPKGEYNDFNRPTDAELRRAGFLKSQQDLIKEAKRRGKRVHMGRVNSWKRMEMANYGIQADSADGNYIGAAPDKNLPVVLNWLRGTGGDEFKSPDSREPAKKKQVNAVTELSPELQRAGISIVVTAKGWSVRGLPQEIGDEIAEGWRGRRTAAGYFFKENPTEAIEDIAEEILAESREIAAAEASGNIRTAIGTLTPKMAAEYERERNSRIAMLMEEPIRQRESLGELVAQFVSPESRGGFKRMLDSRREKTDASDISGFDLIVQFVRDNPGLGLPSDESELLQMLAETNADLDKLRRSIAKDVDNQLREEYDEMLMQEIAESDLSWAEREAEIQAIEESIEAERELQGRQIADEIDIANRAVDEVVETDLFGNPIKPEKETKTAQVEPDDVSQGMLFDKSGAPGQMNLFPAAGVPDDMVAIKDEQAEGEPPVNPESMVERTKRANELWQMTDEVKIHFQTQEQSLKDKIQNWVDGKTDAPLRIIGDRSGKAWVAKTGQRDVGLDAANRKAEKLAKEKNRIYSVVTVSDDGDVPQYHFVVESNVSEGAHGSNPRYWAYEFYIRESFDNATILSYDPANYKPIKPAQDSLEDKLNDLPDILMQREDTTRDQMREAIDIALDAKDAGLTSYDDFIEFAVESLGERRARLLGSYLEMAAKSAGMKGVRPAKDVLGDLPVTRGQAVSFAKAAFPMLTEEQIEAGIELMGLTKFGRDEIGFATFGTPIPSDRLSQADVNPDDMPKSILNKMYRRLKSQGYNLRGAEDVRQLLKQRNLLDYHQDWIAAYEFATGSEANRKEKQDAKKEFRHVNWTRLRQLGNTDNMMEAGYIKPDGALADLSGKREGGSPGMRSYDHREAGGTAGMQEVIASGWIRMDANSGSIDLAASPTTAQIKRIRELAEMHDGELTVDLNDGLGPWNPSYGNYFNPPMSWAQSYPKGTKPQRIINDIKRFFDGNLPVTLFQEDRQSSAAEAFDQDQIEKNRKPGYKSREKLIEIAIDDFLSLAHDGKSDDKAAGVRGVRATGGSFSSLPYLNISKGRVTGHEGRHRAMALKAEGYTTMPVVLVSSDIRWSEQDSPSKFDYVKEWPTELRAQAGARNEKFSIPFPVSREDAMVPYRSGQESQAAIGIWATPQQEISSADTSINQGKLPASFKRIDWKPGTVNADIGGGRFDNATEMLAGLGVENVIYDPFNRSQEHNKDAVDKIAGGKADTATVNNVLNVIKEPAARMQVIRQAADAVGVDGTAYFLIYEGDGSGNSKATSKGWQENRKAETYISEIESVFGKVARKGAMLIASNAFSRSQKNQTDTPAFKKWFGDSKVVDADGNPLVVYHGTGAEFTEFNEKLTGGVGFYFAKDVAFANQFGDQLRSIMPVYLQINNPAPADVVRREYDKAAGGNPRKVAHEALKSMGYDGIIRGAEIVAFSPGQIKSATGNQGTFDPNNPSILAQNQEQDGNVKGWTKFVSATRAIIGATDKADFSTFIHELFHPMRRFLLDRSVPIDKREGITDQDIQALEDYAGVKDGVWTRAAEEKAAKAWEQYWLEGKSPTEVLRSLFEKIARWMRQVYNGVQQITGNELTPEVRALFDKIVQRGLPEGVRRPPSHEEVGPPPVDSPSHPERVERVAPNRHEFTALGKAVMNEMREIANLPGLETYTKETVAGWIEQAEITLANDPSAALRLYREVASNPGRAINQHEATLLAFHYRKLANDADIALQESIEAFDSNDPVRIAQARTDFIRSRAPMTEFEQLTLESKSTWGRTGVALQMMLRKDFTYEGLMRRSQHYNHGKPLSKEQKDEIAALSKKIAELQAELDKYTASGERGAAEKESVRQHDEVVKTTPVKTVEPAGSQKAKIDAKWKAFTQATGRETLFQAENVYEGIVNAYREIGVTTFAELMRHVLERLGDAQAKELKGEFRQAWNNSKPEDDLRDVIDPSDASAVTKLARQIQREFVEAGMRDRVEVIEAVRQELSATLGQEFTTIETIEALTKYGQYTVPSQDGVDPIIRKMNAESLKARQIIQLEDALRRADELRSKNPDMTEEEIGNQLVKEDLLVKPTGPQRDVAWPDLRAMQRTYNELKSKIPASTEGRAGMLQTTLGAIERALANRILDLRQALKPENETPINNERRPSPTNEAIEKMRKEVAELVVLYRAKFPPKRATMTEEQRIKNAVRAAERSIKSLEDQIATHNFDKPKSIKVSSPQLESLRAQRESLRTHIEALKALELQQWESEGGALAPDSRESAYRKTYLASVERRIAEYKRRIAENDLAPRKKQSRTLTKEELDAGRRLADAKREALEAMSRYHVANLKGIHKVVDWLKESAHLSRALMTSMDASALFNQGATVVLANPKMAVKILMEIAGSLIRSFKQGNLFDRKNLTWERAEEFLTGIDSRQAEYEFMRKLTNGEWAEFRIKAGLQLPESDQDVKRQEEIFQGRWGRYFPGVALSSRVYTMMLNKMRADLFDKLANSVAIQGKPTLEEAKLIAHFVNVSTGRSDLKGVPLLDFFEKHSSTLNTVFFAPRYVLSRFQYLAMPFYLPFAGGGLSKNAAVKAAIRAEMAKTLIGFSTLMGSIALSSLLFWDDDDEDKPVIGTDPTTSDFMKVKFGDTRLDFGGGIQQAFVLMSRVGFQRSGDRKFGEGYNPETTGTLMARFARTKLAPVPGYIVTGMNDWKDVVGNRKTDVMGIETGPEIANLTNLMLPLSGQSIIDAMRDNGAVPGTFISVLAFLGVRVGTYGERTTYLNANEERRKLEREKFLRNMEWDTPDPGFSEFLTQEQFDEVQERRENRKQALVNAALEDPSPESFKNPEDFAKAIARRDEAIEKVKAAGWTTEEIRQLILDYWRSNHGSPRHLRNGMFMLKDGVRARIRRIERIFGGAGRMVE